MHCLAKLAIICLSLIYFSTAYAQADSLNWNAAKKLHWDDFKGEPEEGTLVGARTFTTLKYKLYDYDTSCYVVVKCVFLARLSWRKDDDTTAYALQHEQGHFDISEIYARKLRKAFNQYQYSQRTVNADVVAIFNRLCEEKTKFNDRYDKETSHSLDRAKQQEWNTKISMMLDELKEFEQVN